MKSTITFSATLCASFFAASFAWADFPTVDWASSPVKPGEHVLLNGGGWDKDAVVEIGGQRVKPVRVTDAGLVFAYPSAKEEILTGKVVTKNGTSAPFTLNAPEAWSMFGDESDYSTPGGWIRLFGKGLAGGEVRVEKWEGGKVEKSATNIPPFHSSTIPLKLTRVDEYELAAKIPSDIEAGEYAVEVKSAISGWVKVGTWKIAAPRQLWKTDVFDVKAFGAVPNDGLDDSLAFTNALAAAAKNGGGIIHFPRGTYNLSGTFEVPAHVLIRGAGQDLSRLDWGDMLDPPHYLLLVEHSFGLTDLTIHTGFSRGFLTHKSATPRDSIWLGTFVPKTHDLVFRNLTCRFVTDEHRDRMTEREFLRRYWWNRQYPYGKAGVPFKLEDVERCTLENVDIYQDKDPNSSRFFVLTGWYVRVSKCKFHGGGWTEFGGRKFIFEDTENRCCTHSLTPVSSEGYFARNVGYDNFKNDGEGLTHDSQCHVAQAKGRAAGTAVTLVFDEKQAKSRRNGILETIDRQKDFQIQIVAGRGAGQVRRIVAMPDWEHVTIDKPFGTLPDETSLFNIAFQRYKMLWIDNRMEDASVGLQLWGDGDDYILARNTFLRGGGIRVDGLGTTLPCFRVQVLDNVLEGSLGRATRGISIEGTSWASVIRRNVLDSNATLDAGGTDTLVERNVVRDTRFAFGGDTAFFLGENTYENVANPYRGTAQAVLSDGAKATRAAWFGEVTARLKSGKALTRADVDLYFGIRACLQTGTDEMKAARAGSTKTFALPLNVMFDPSAPDVAGCSVVASECGGWKFRMKDAALKRTGNVGEWSGLVEITPSGEVTGIFTIPLVLRITGKEGWTAELPIDAGTTTQISQAYIHSDNLSLPEFAYAVVKGNDWPKDYRKLAWKKVTHFLPDGRIDALKYDMDPEFLRGKDSMAFEQRWDVKKPTHFTIRVDDPSREIYLDGRKIVPVPSYARLRKNIVLEPGEHSIIIFRPHPAPMDSYRVKKLGLEVFLPRGAEPGSYRVIPASKSLPR